MPELPEVETIRRGLEDRMVGKTVRRTATGGGRLFRHNPGGSAEVESALLGATVTGVERRGKFLWLTLQQPRTGEVGFVVHLGMSGQVHLQSRREAHPGSKRHEHMWVKLDSGEGVSFVDQRTFGHLTLSPIVQLVGRRGPKFLSHIAPDPLEDAFDVPAALAAGQKSSRRVKTLLLDQEFISGVGNIYADEALFAAGITGFARGADLSDSAWKRLLAGTAWVMGEALAAGGTSFDELYVDVDGNPGYFERSLQVYGRQGQECYKCGARVERTVIGGRSHYFCPRLCGPHLGRKVLDERFFK